MLDTVSNARPAIIRAQEGTTTGISAFDRAATFRALASPTTVPGDFNRPGHVFPLRPREGGVLERDGHTEASVDFCKLAGLHECGVLSEICNEDGSMSRVPEVHAAPAQPITPSHPLLCPPPLSLLGSAVAASSLAQLRTFCEEHGLVLTSIHDLREHLKAMPK